MAKKLPELSHVQVGRVLFVAGEARRGSRATIKPLASTRVLLRGKRAFYCITLRPKFFRASTPEERVETLLHELLHISAEFDGRLHEERRHSSLPGAKFRSLLRPLVRRYLAHAEPTLLSGLGHHGEVVARQWKPDTVIATHSHSFAAKALVVQGEMWLTVGGRTQHLKPGDGFELEPGVPHDEFPRS